MQKRPAAATPVAWVVVALWAPYALLNTLFSGPLLTYGLGLLIALVALGLLWSAGVSPRACFLALAPPSRPGLVLLALLSAFIPAALLLGRGQPFNWLEDLVYAPASALGQELFFRSALLVALGTVCRRGDARLALAGQALAFALWHVRAFRVAPLAPAVGVLVVTFMAGLLWGMQVRRDRTVLYSVLQHALFLAIQ
jgi:membrane protease YdiL (CAAX protease family)